MVKTIRKKLDVMSRLTERQWRALNRGQRANVDGEIYVLERAGKGRVKLRRLF